ncbi:MAG: tetratricopeptide repeat protein [Candidatus Omnitrophica bacterium]|nr:tetratricopeptide repeat protein [Candidatus Omnitrophota bacterium]
MKKNKRCAHTYIKTSPHWPIVITIFILGLAVYSQSFIKGVFLFDDKALIIDNPYIKNFSHIKDIFTTHLFHGSGIYSNFYRPIQSLSFMLDYHLWGLNPFGYHLVSVLIHILNSVMVYFLIYLISKKQYIAAVTAILFCVHTVLSILVNYVAARADILSTLFFLAALALYVLYKQAKANRYKILLYMFSALSFISALLTKEMAIIFPFVLLLYMICFPEEVNSAGKKPQSLIWIFFLIIGIYALFRFTVLDFTGGKLLETTTGNIPLYNRLLTTSKVFMIYLRLLFFPVGLHMEWNIPLANSFMQDEVFLSVVGLIIAGFFVYFLSRTSKLKFFAISWFLVTLFPQSNIFPLNYFMSESWLYIPSIGFFTLLAIYLYDLKQRSKFCSLLAAFIIFSSVMFYGILTFKRADTWADPIKLYTEVLRYSPNNTKARINLGVILAKSGSYDEAMQKYKEAKALMPDDASVHAGLANVYADKKMYDVALEEFKKAVELNPKDYVAHNNIGIIYKQKGDIKKAMEKYAEALKLNPSYPLTYNNIGNIYLDSGQYDAAIRFYKKAINLDPNKAAFYANLGKAYKGKGMRQKAKESFEKAFELDPNHREAIEGLKTLN